MMPRDIDAENKNYSGYNIKNPISAATHLERQKLIVSTAIGLFFIFAFALVLNHFELTRLKSDIFLRWYPTTKLFSEGRNIYDPKNGKEVWQILFNLGGNPFGGENNFLFFYPAHLLIFIAPLALLPYQTAHLIWTITVQLFYVASISLAIRASKWPTTNTTITIFLGLALIFIPHIQHTIWGQFNTIGMLGLVLSILALRDGRYTIAGAWAVCLTFKPQNDLLTLAFLLFWSLWHQKRWLFFAGFGLVSSLCWLFAELLQPDWVISFFASLSHYTATKSVMDEWGRTGQIITPLLVLLSLATFYWQRKAAPNSTAFMACVTLSMGVWALIVPIVGMMHIVFLTLAVVWLVPIWQRQPAYGAYPLYTFVTLYFLGWLGFLLGFLTHTGAQIVWAEAAYKVLFPWIVILFSLPLCWQKEIS